MLKTGMIMKKKPVMETKGVRDDIEEEDSEESYYRYSNISLIFFCKGFDEGAEH